MAYPVGEGAVEVRRWARYGKDRLYVTLGGAPIGWWDLTSNQGHPAEPRHFEALRVAVARWVGAPVDPPPRVPHPPPPPRPWTDLAVNQPGQSVLAQVALIEAQRQALAWPPQPPRRSFITWLTATRDERQQHHQLVQTWRHTNEQQLRFDRHLQSQARPWHVGADGEWLVAREIGELIRMDPRWRVLHAVPVGTAGSDIDHVLIGPGGVFTLNAKHHPGKSIWVAGSTFLVNGRRHPYIRNSRHEAARASTMLTRACGFPVSVRPIIVPVNARSFKIQEAPEGVDVINRQRLILWIRRYAEQVPPHIIEQIFAAARRSTTWS